MIWTLLIIYWIILGSMIASALFMKNYQNYQILGVTLSKENSKTTEVQGILKSYCNVFYLLLLAFFVLSLLMLWKPLLPFVEFYMLFLTVALLVIIMTIEQIYQNKLRSLKEENHWIYQSNHIVIIDTNASKEKGKSAVSIFWSWIFLVLSFIPTIYLILNPEFQKIYPIPFSLIGPVCQLTMFYMYRQVLNRHTPALSDNSEINKACARTEEHIGTLAATLSGLVILLFWIFFSMGIIYNIVFSTIFVTVFMVIFLLAIAFWQQKKTLQAQEYFFATEQNAGSNNEDKEIYEQGDFWKFGCYNNPNDPRLFVPKRVAGMGWTINIGKPLGKYIMLGISLLTIAIILLVFAGAMTEYKIEEINNQITISGTMYKTTFDRNDIVSVEKITKIPNCTRTNGYGGVKKSFGHFQVTDYGSCMFYLYNDIKEYIVIKLKHGDQPYIFVNDKSLDKTEELYKYLKSLNE